MKKVFTNPSHLINIIKNFTPNWFAATMGTGITAVCLHNFAYLIPSVDKLATVLWLMNILLFAIFAILFIVRIVMFPKQFVRLMSHSIQPMFIGCIPMGLATIINGFTIFAVPVLADRAVEIAQYLWYIDIALALLSCLVVPYFMFNYQQHSLTSVTAIWLLPFVACEVAAASGGILVSLVHAHKVAILVSSIMLWSISIVLSLGILVIYFQRLTMHSMPDKQLAASIWLPLGPTSTGALGMFLISNNSKTINTLNMAYSSSLVDFIRTLPGVALVFGMILWAIASWWFLMAVIGTIRYVLRSKLEFNLGFWGYTFPLGTYILASINLQKQIEIPFLQIFALMLSLALALAWLIIFCKTIYGLWHGHLIKDPTQSQ